MSNMMKIVSDEITSLRAEVERLRTQGFLHLSNYQDAKTEVSRLTAELEAARSNPWISEGDSLPQIGSTVLLLTPRSTGDFWDLKVVFLAARHEGVVARPVKDGDNWPTDYFWERPRGPSSTNLVTGKSFWAYADFIPLPEGAYHDQERGFHFIRAAHTLEKKL